MQSDLISVRATIHLMSTEDGGRRHPFGNGYRPNHNFGLPHFYIGSIETDDTKLVHPGTTVSVKVHFLNLPGLRELIHVGREWRIQEGQYLVATGVIDDVLTAE